MPENIITQDVVENAFWKQSWFKKQNPERYGNLIVDKPIMRIGGDGDFVTSPILIADSINYFIEKHLLGYTTYDTDIKLPSKVIKDAYFKDAISEPFEQKCIEYFRSLGFTAGHVSKKEVWKTQNANIDMKSSHSNLYGEIDVLAYHQDLEMLFPIINFDNEEVIYTNFIKLKNAIDNVFNKI